MPIPSARSQLISQISNLTSATFAEVALAVFQYQAQENILYREYLRLLRVSPDKVQSLEEIPYLPIQFFKTHELKTGLWQPELSFSSSGTSGDNTSRHPVRNLQAYEENTLRGFSAFYGDPADLVTLALLPAYLERQGSSLVYMADYFIRRSRYAESGFFLHNNPGLVKIIETCQQKRIPTLLLGVSFALWDLAEQFQLPGDNLIIMETGGMKGRREEIVREELHRILLQSFGVTSIHSEYGMTELFSQAYSQGDGIFFPAPTMQVRPREITDPFAEAPLGRTGVLDIIDLANLDTISFIATEDLGKVYADGSFRCWADWTAVIFGAVTY